MKIAELTSRMAQRAEQLTPLSSAPMGVILPAPDLLRSFVEPELSQLAGLEKSERCKSSVILVSAPAAVGKTTLARHLARVTNNPYWDLGKFAMGSGFFSGIISSAYGVERYASLIEEIRCGRLCLILDAVDEAIVASTSTNFIASLQNLSEIIQGANTEHASAIFFGRPETIIDTHLYLADLGIDSEMFEVLYFSEDESKRFVREQIAASNVNILGELDPFIDTFFNRVKEAFYSPEWSVVGSFLGYAPVLDSLALFYRESENAFKELNDFVSDGSRTWALIGDMLNRVLHRETEKFAASFGGTNQVKREFAASAYSAKTQIQWLLADDLTTLSVEPDLSIAEDEWLADIEQSIRDQFEVHPFLRSRAGDHARNVLLGFTSAAFRDYVVAQFLIDADSADLAVLQSYWLQPEIIPSMMLSKFFRCHEKRNTPLDPKVLAFLLDSHSKQSPENAELMYVEWQADDEDEAAATDRDHIVVTIGGNGESQPGFTISTESREIQLGRSAAYAVIALPQGKVVLGPQLAESDIGPRLAIESEIFSAQSSDIHVNQPAPLGGSSLRRLGVNIRTERIDGIVRKITGSRDQLSLRVPVAPYPWQPFKVQDEVNKGPAEEDLLFIGLALRRIAVWFGRGGMRFARVKMDALLSKGRASRRLFDFLLSRGYIWIDDPFYRMDRDVSLGAIRTLDLADVQYRNLLTEAFHALAA